MIQFAHEFMKLLIYSLDPMRNYQEAKKHCIPFLVVMIIISILVYFANGIVLSLCTLLALGLLEVLDMYFAYKMKDEIDAQEIKQAIKNGKIWNLVSTLLLSVLFLVLFGIKTGIVLVTILVLECIYKFRLLK